jgi:hypothetical protein
LLTPTFPSGLAIFLCLVGFLFWKFMILDPLKWGMVVSGEQSTAHRSSLFIGNIEKRPSFAGRRVDMGAVTVLRGDF